MRHFILICTLLAITSIPEPGLAQQLGSNVLLNHNPADAGQGNTSADGDDIPLTADALLGPPNPATMYALVGLSEAQLLQYVAAYRAHLAATWDIRVATLSALGLMGQALKSSEAERVRYYGLMLDQLWGRLRAEDGGFVMALESVLQKKQLQAFRTWRAAWIRGARSQQRIQTSLIENMALVR